MQYAEDGYVVLDGLLSAQECDELRRRMEEIVEEMDVPEHCRTVFSTYHDEQTKKQVAEPRCLECPAASHSGSSPLTYLSSLRAFQLFLGASRCR